MIIIDNDLNSMPQQVEENKKNIKLLASYLKEAYKTPNDLGNSAVSIAISNTNATADTIDGWLITHDGYLYKITNGDGTNLLLEYYTYLRGETGANGTDGADGTNGTDGKSFILTTGTIIIGYTATIQATDFNITPNVNDLVLDGNSIVGKVTAINGSDVSVLGLYSIKGETGANGVDGVTNGLISFSNVNVDTSNFVSSVEYVDYPYEAVVVTSSSLIGTITGGMVTFNVPEANSGDFASVCKIDNVNGTITIFSKSIPNGDFIIPNIWVIKQA